MTLTKENVSKLIEPLAKITNRTGDLLLAHYESGEFKTYSKADESPVTSADIAASELLTKELSLLTPDVPVLSEEAIQPWRERKRWQTYWLVDPLDGTQEFVAGSGDFAVSIALIHGGKPVLGMIGWPVADRLYFAAAGYGAFKRSQGHQERIHVRKLEDPRYDPITIALSRRQPESRVLSRLGERRPIAIMHAGSCALKSALVAEGKADVFMRIGPTGEWDTGAAEILVQEAGGQLLDLHFQPLTYNQTADTGNPNFLVLGDPLVQWDQIFPAPVVDN